MKNMDKGRIHMSNSTKKDIRMLEWMDRLLDDMPFQLFISIYSCSRMTVLAGEGKRLDTRDCLVMLLVEDGSGTFEAGGESGLIGRGTIVFGWSQRDLELIAPMGTKAMVIITILMKLNEPENTYRLASVDGLNQADTSWRLLDESTLLVTLQPGQLRKYREWFRSIQKNEKKELTHARTLLSSCAAGHLLLQFYHSLHFRIHHPNFRDRRLSTAKLLIDAAPQRRFSIGELAEDAGLSAKYFSTLFKSQYGVTPLEYQVTCRMEHAITLLESSVTVKEVALLLGYPDPYSFSKQFKHVIGYPPSEVRKPLKGNVQRGKNSAVDN
jgi:AraC-like DNA-binding protein